MFDALVIGAGPAGLSIGADLSKRGLKVSGLAPTSPQTPWVNTYGIWCDELETLNLSHLLKHRWENCVSYFSQGEWAHQRAYGLFDKTQLQNHLLDQAQDMTWIEGQATELKHYTDYSAVLTATGEEIKAKIVIDTSGHQPVFIQRPTDKVIAYQAAYGVVGRFSAPPIALEQFVLMDYRSDHLSAEEKCSSPPTFLYAMDFGNDVYFVEETSSFSVSSGGV